MHPFRKPDFPLKSSRVQEEVLHTPSRVRQNSTPPCAFRSTIEVMLLDGILTREEKRLIIRLSSCLDLEPHQPAEIYQAIIDGNDTEDGEPSLLKNSMRFTKRCSK